VLIITGDTYLLLCIDASVMYILLIPEYMINYTGY